MPPFLPAFSALQVRPFPTISVLDLYPNPMSNVTARLGYDHAEGRARDVGKGGLANYGPNREVYVRCWRQREERSFAPEAVMVFCNRTQSAWLAE